jgi:uncharacterized membrane protein
MNPAAADWNDQRVEVLMGNLLRAGVVLAAAVVLFGGVLYLVRHGDEREDHRKFHGEAAELTSPSGVLADALEFRARGIIQLGLLLLIATPVARVAFSVFAFLRERDFTYVVLTLIVLTLLFYSLFVGRVG